MGLTTRVLPGTAWADVCPRLAGFAVGVSNGQSSWVETETGERLWTVDQPMAYLRVAAAPDGSVALVGVSAGTAYVSVNGSAAAPRGPAINECPVGVYWDGSRFVTALQRTPDLVDFLEADGTPLRRQAVPWTSQGFDLAPDGTMTATDRQGPIVFDRWPMGQRCVRAPWTAAQSGWKVIGAHVDGRVVTVLDVAHGDVAARPRLAVTGDRLVITASQMRAGCPVVLIDRPYPPDEPYPFDPPVPVPVPPPVAVTPKATIESYDTPVRVGQPARAVARILQGEPDRFWWQYQRGGIWLTAADNGADDLDHHYVFPAPGDYPIRLQTVKDGAVTDTTGLRRAITVR